MAEEAKNAARGPSFSEMTELPPLKEVYIAPPPPPAAVETEPEPAMSSLRKQPEKPKVQPREVARKAVKEIKKTPPKLFLYSIAGAVAIILLVVGFIAFRIHSENSEDEGSAAAPAATAPVAAAKPAWNPAQPPLTAATGPAGTGHSGPGSARGFGGPQVRQEQEEGQSTAGCFCHRDSRSTQHQFHPGRRGSSH